MKRKLLACLTAVLFATALVTTLSSFVSDDESGGGDWFTAHHDTTVQCQEVTFTKTTFFNASGQVVGTTVIQGGVIKVEFKGSYSSSETTSGRIAAHPSTARQCYDLALTPCTSISAVQACL